MTESAGRAHTSSRERNVFCEESRVGQRNQAHFLIRLERGSQPQVGQSSACYR